MLKMFNKFFCTRVVMHHLTHCGIWCSCGICDVDAICKLPFIVYCLFFYWKLHWAVLFCN